MDVEREVVCIDCGGRAHLLTPPEEGGGYTPGTWVSYRCADCLDRWDLLVEEDSTEED